MEFRKKIGILSLLSGSGLLLLIYSCGPKEEPLCGNSEDRLAQWKHRAGIDTGENGFITGLWGAPSGLGNQIYRFASLYGIGQRLNRLAYFDSGNAQQMSFLPELLTTFPKLFDSLYVLSPNRSDFENRAFSKRSCCYYDGDYAKLDNVSSRFLELSANYFQSYKYFHPYRTSVISALAFGPQVAAEAKQLADSIFSKASGSPHLLCVHVRRTDFIGHFMLESKRDFIEPALRFIVKGLEQKGVKRMSLLFVGDDRNFTKKIDLNDLNFSSVINSQPTSRGADLCFGASYCDTILLSSSGSTFGFWMAYLSDRATIYCNAQLTKHAVDMSPTTGIADEDLIPTEWIRLRIENGSAVEERRWWHEYNGLN